MYDTTREEKTGTQTDVPRHHLHHHGFGALAGKTGGKPAQRASLRTALPRRPQRKVLRSQEGQQLVLQQPGLLVGGEQAVAAPQAVLAVAVFVVSVVVVDVGLVGSGGGGGRGGG